jgi:hypothetical protein
MHYQLDRVYQLYHDVYMSPHDIHAFVSS